MAPGNAYVWFKKYEKIQAKNAIFQLGRRKNVLYSMVTIAKKYICEYYYQNFPHKNEKSLNENVQKLVWSSHFKMILTNVFIFESITHVHNEIGAYLPPVSSFQLDTLLSQLHVCSSFFDNPLSSVSASHMCMGVGHPPEHGEPPSGHIFDKELFSSR